MFQRRTYLSDCAIDQQQVVGVDPVGVDVGGDEQVAGRLGRRVGRGGVERRGLGEGAGLDRAVDLVGGDLQVALDAELAGRVEQRAGADHVGAGEGVLVVDRAVDVGLGGEVDDRVGALHRLADDGGSSIAPSISSVPSGRFSRRPA